MAAAKYPPLGERSVGIARAQLYGLDFSGYVERANREVALIIQIEHIDALRNLDEILAVPGVDAIFVGPYDLSGSMGKLGQLGDAEVQDAISFVKKRCIEMSVPYGLFVGTPEEAAKQIDEGCRLIAVGIDANALARWAVNSLKLLRG